MSNKFTATTKAEKVSIKIIKSLNQAGFEAFWVGGIIRDKLLGKQSDNVDIATSAKPTEVQKILRTLKIHQKEIGKEFGTILAVAKNVLVEITTFRKEGEYKDRRHPKKIQFISDYNQDSKRRDFTINSLYYSPLTKELLDPNRGLLDISRGLIKFVGNPKKRIDEDALRMLRAARLATQLNFKIEKNSFAAIKTRSKFIQHISGERIKKELDKILAQTNKVDGFKLLDDLGLLKFIMPEVIALKKIFHKSKLYHLEGNVFDHTMLVLKSVPDSEINLSYAALFHDTGKALTIVPKQKPEGLVNSFPRHEFVSADLFKNFAKRFKFSRNDTNLILWITKMHMTRIAFLRHMRAEEKYELATHHFFNSLIQLWRADAIGNFHQDDEKVQPGVPFAWQEAQKFLKTIKAKANLIKKLSKGEKIISLGKVPSGPRIKTLQNIVAIKILSNDIKNDNDLKLFLKNV